MHRKTQLHNYIEIHTDTDTKIYMGSSLLSRNRAKLLQWILPQELLFKENAFNKVKLQFVWKNAKPLQIKIKANT